MAVMERVQSMLESFQQAAHGAPTWPPRDVKERWAKIEGWRRYYQNDPGAMLQHAPAFNRSDEGRDIFTPVALAREVCRYSADLMFSAEPVITFENDEQLLERVMEANGLEADIIGIAEYIAAEGRGGLRVIKDTDISEIPLITHVHEDQIIWNERHGRFVLGGTIVITRVEDANQRIIYRLLEEHTAGKIERRLYKGNSYLLGKEVALNTLPEFKDLIAEEETGLDQPTLIRWDNVSGGKSDLDGQEALLDKINEEFSRGMDKSRKSTPVTFAARELADEAGSFDLWGIYLTGTGNLAQSLGEDPAKTVETVQPDFGSNEVISWVDFLIDSALLFMGYSKASYGRDQGGSADSGKALRLRQARTLLKKAGKDRMAIRALEQAYAVAMAWEAGSGTVKDYMPDVKLGDGLPRDETEAAQDTLVWTQAGAASLEEKIKARRPDWDQEAVDAEMQRIEADPQTQPTQRLANTRRIFEGIVGDRATGNGSRR